jgi:hypothetical protein
MNQPIEVERNARSARPLAIVDAIGYNDTMPRPWTTLAAADTDEGTMTLMQRGEELIIRMPSYILMSSHSHLSEAALGRTACTNLGNRKTPRVLIAGLGMGFTLKAALDVLPQNAKVTVAELNPIIVEWCRGPLSELTDMAITDPRVDIRVTDVARLIGSAAATGPRYDAIVLDLYQGTHDANIDPEHPFYGRRAVERTRRALTDDGIFAVWTEHADRPFEARLRSTGFTVQRTRPGKGGPRYVVYLARSAAAR